MHFIANYRRSDCQYVRIANVGYYVVIIYCPVAIVYCIILLFDSRATFVVNKNEHNVARSSFVFLSAQRYK